MASPQEKIAELERRLAAVPNSEDVPLLRRELGCQLAILNESERAYRETTTALQEVKSAGRMDEPLGSILMLDLGDRLVSLDRSDESLAVYDEALERLRRTHDENGHAIWAAVERRAIAARNLGDFSAAEQGLRSVLVWRRGQPVSPALVQSLLENAILERATGRMDRAGAYLQEASHHARQLKDDDLMADTLEQLGALAVTQREFGHGIEFHKLSHAIRHQRLGNRHPKTQHSLTAYGEALVLAGKLEEARQLFEQLRKIGGFLQSAQNEFFLADISFRQGKTAESIPYYESALTRFGEMNHRLRALVSRDAVLAHFSVGNVTRAIELAELSVEAASELWRSVRSYGSEAERLAWRSITDVVSAAAAVAGSEPEILMQCLMRFKASVVDSLATVRVRSGRTAEPPELADARDTLRRLELKADTEPPDRTQARRLVEELESEMARSRRVQENLSEPSIRELMEAVGPHRLLVEFVRYQEATGQGTFETWYGALVGNMEQGFKWIRLGPAAEMDAAIGVLNGLVRQRFPPTDQVFTEASDAVFRLVWKPVDSLISKTVREIILIPDAELSVLSFAILSDGERLLGENLRFRYATSARDLVLRRAVVSSAKTAVIVADPDFDQRWWSGLGDRVRRLGGILNQAFGFRGGELPRSYSQLPGAADEGRALSTLLREKGSYDVVLLEGATATKAAVLKAGSPSVFHLATHGQFLSANSRTSNPMLRAWLALSGANRSLAELHEGKSVDLDGLLLADEIARLNLQDTQLVTMSACDTGAGTVRAGEGVFGLRRAFRLAGAHHLLLTLWPVDDRVTAGFMARFYELFLEVGDPVIALSDVQGTQLSEIRQKLGPMRAAQVAGAFLISS
jgi:CHAT domain-containing protein/tetratricopeptide (TPR) repeat protein